MHILLITTLPNKVASALREKADVIDCRNYNTIAERLQSYRMHCTPDLLITYRCPYILPSEIYVDVPLGAFNIHPSLLPKYKGLNPWEAIIRNNEKESGVTIHRITEAIDGGEIMMQQTFAINTSFPLNVLRAQADEIAAEMIIEFVNHDL